MSILLRNRITGITTSTDLFGEDLALFLREYPDLVKVGIGTTANQPYYILLNETIEEFRSPYANNGLSYNPSTGTLSAGVFSGNGSGLSNVTATGSGIEIKDDNVLVGTARTVNFANNLSVTFASGISTISGASSVSAATTAYGLAGTPNLSVGIVTATGAIVGSAVTINSSGVNVTGIITATSFSGNGANLTGIVTATGAIVGSAVTINSSGVNVTGIITATSFSGNGANLTGIDATRIVNGNSNITVNSNNTITTTANSVTISTVSSAGMAMSSGKRFDLSSFTETVNTLGSAGSPISGSNTLDVGTYSTFIAYVGTSSVTFSLTGVTAGKLVSWTIILIYTNSGSRTVNFSFGTLRYPGGASSVTLSNTAVHDVLSFFTADNASNTYASIIGLGFVT